MAGVIGKGEGRGGGGGEGGEKKERERGEVTIFKKTIFKKANKLA